MNTGLILVLSCQACNILIYSVFFDFIIENFQNLVESLGEASENFQDLVQTYGETSENFQNLVRNLGEASENFQNLVETLGETFEKLQNIVETFGEAFVKNTGLTLEIKCQPCKISVSIEH